MEIPNFDLLGSKKVVLRGMMVNGMYDLQLVHVTLRPTPNQPNYYEICDAHNPDMIYNEKGTHPYFEVARSDIRKLQQHISALECLFEWFVTDAIEESNLYPLLYELAMAAIV